MGLFHLFINRQCHGSHTCRTDRAPEHENVQRPMQNMKECSGKSLLTFYDSLIPETGHIHFPRSVRVTNEMRKLSFALGQPFVIPKQCLKQYLLAKTV